MAKHGEFQKRLLKNIGIFYQCDLVETTNESYEFTIRVRPFKSNASYLLIEKFKTMDALRLVGVIHTSPKIQKIFNDATKEDLSQIEDQFQEVYLKQRMELVFGKDYETLQNIKPVFTQNLSYQFLIDSIKDNIILVRDVVKLLIAMDNKVQPTEVEKNHSMFQ